MVQELEKIGEQLYETRAKFMVDTDQGLTKTYNALKDPTVSAPGSSRLRFETNDVDLLHRVSRASHAHHGAQSELERIVHLRQLHIDMDRAVLEAYARHASSGSSRLRSETNDVDVPHHVSDASHAHHEGDPTWTQIQIPPFTDPVTDAEKELHQRFEDHVLDKLFELNEVRSRV